MTIAQAATVEQGRTALAAMLLFALIVVVALTAVSLLLLSLHRRRNRPVARPAPVELTDAWSESARRLGPRREPAAGEDGNRPPATGSGERR